MDMRALFFQGGDIRSMIFEYKAAFTWQLYANYGTTDADIDYIIDWGQGEQPQHVTTVAELETPMVGVTLGTCKITPLKGKKIRVSFYRPQDSTTLQTSDHIRLFKQFGDSVIGKNMFLGLSNVFFNSVPDYPKYFEENIQNCFFNCNVKSIPHIEKWDLSNVKNISNMFRHAERFNQDISSWDVSNVELMIRTFEDAKNFNQDLSSWCVGNVSSHSSFSNNATSWTLPKPNFANPPC